MNRKITMHNVKNARQYAINKRLAESIMNGVKLSLNKSLNEGSFSSWKEINVPKFDQEGYIEILSPIMIALKNLLLDGEILYININVSIQEKGFQIGGFMHDYEIDNPKEFLRHSLKTCQNIAGNDFITAMNRSYIIIGLKSTTNFAKYLKSEKDPVRDLIYLNRDSSKAFQLKLIDQDERLKLCVAIPTLMKDDNAQIFIDFID